MEELLRQVNKNLEVLIALTVQSCGSTQSTLREQVGRLSTLGLQPAEIARILGKKRETINAEVGKIRTKRKPNA